MSSRRRERGSRGGLIGGQVVQAYWALVGPPLNCSRHSVAAFWHVSSWKWEVLNVWTDTRWAAALCAGVLIVSAGCTRGPVALPENSGADPSSIPNPDTTRIALLHMASNPRHAPANRRTIRQAMTVAESQGADWLVTPELAESGYAFARHRDPDRLPQYPPSWLQPISQAADRHDLTVFLGFPQHVKNREYNAVAVIDDSGQVVGVHRKNDVIPSPLESWATPGSSRPIEVDGASVGVFVCADAADRKIARQYRAAGVDVMISSAAWYPLPGMGPLPFWKRLSADSPAPFVVANTTGRQGGIDFRRSLSGAFVDGRPEVKIRSPRTVVESVDWNRRTGEVVSAPEGRVLLN